MSTFWESFSMIPELQSVLEQDEPLSMKMLFEIVAS